MSDEQKKSPTADKEGRKKLIISEEAMRRMLLEEEELRHVVGGEIPKTPTLPGQSPIGGGG